MSGSIELHAFMGLADLFRQRQWTNPCDFPLAGETSGADLLAELDIPREGVEVMFINRKAIATDSAVVHPGDSRGPVREASWIPACVGMTG